METGEIIRNLRIKNNLTSKELSRILNVSESSISLYESGKRNPSISQLVKLSDYFKVSTDFLLGIDRKENSDITFECDLSEEIGKIVYFLDNSEYIFFDGRKLNRQAALVIKSFFSAILENMRLLTML
ncbi:MAG: helix-turn-helix transcriptional regulator [Sedimentibacter sp.]|uniref:helix-turn-helix domain-containing protein n=1 Tax=Sedimentibacter sp. TaxID=1960295 RepID=UPI003158AC03